MPPSDALSALRTRYPHLLAEPIQPYMGLEIRGLPLDRGIDEPLAAMLRELWLTYRVLLLRDQPIDHVGHMALAQVFGKPIGYPFSTYLVEGYPNIIQILSDQQTADAWHCDLSYDVQPAAGAVLRAVSVPPVGGDTVFADGYRAYETLPDEVKDRIADLRAIHDFAGVFRYQRADVPGHEARLAKAMEKRRKTPLVAHPVVLIHPDTGRKALFVNEAFTTQILDIDPAESRVLLQLLFRQFLIPEHQLRVRWQPGSVAIWENLSTTHYAASDYGDFRRHMERVTVQGTPIYTLS